MVASAPGRIAHHRAPPSYEEFGFRHEFAHFFSQGNQQKLLPPQLNSLTPVCTKSFVGWGFAPDPAREADSTPPDWAIFLRGPEGKRKDGRDIDVNNVPKYIKNVQKT